MNDDFMNQFEKPKPPRPEFAAALYQRITQPMKTSTRTRVLRAFALSFAMVAVIAVVLLFSPSTRAFADAIIRQFQKGDITAQTVNDAASASQLAGFTVLAPAYLPDGYTANDQVGEWTVSHGNDGVWTSISYMNQATGSQFTITEEMVRQRESDTVKNDPESQTVTVRGQPGAWLSGNKGGKGILAWDENGIAYKIGTNTLSKDEVLKVAESLGK